jgi:hypothetical protein
MQNIVLQYYQNISKTKQQAKRPAVSTKFKNGYFLVNVSV